MKGEKQLSLLQNGGEAEKKAKMSEGMINVKILERNDGHTDIILTINEKNSGKALSHLKDLLLLTYPEVFETGSMVEGITEIRITVPSEKEKEEAKWKDLKDYPYPPGAGTNGF